MTKSKAHIPKGLRLSTLYHNILLALLSAVIIVSTVVAMPYTNKIDESLDYNLNLKENLYYLKSYILEFTIKDKSLTSSNLSSAKNVLMNRLDKYGVEVVKITDYQVDTSTEKESETEGEIGSETTLTKNNSDKEYLRVTVDTTKDATYVDTLVRSRNFLRLVTPKEDVDFADQENPLVQYLPESYDFTPFTLRSFRNVLITELSTTTGDTAFFSVYKPKYTQAGRFKDFMAENAGQTIGISIDGFVTPYTVPLDFAASSQTTTTQAPIFAPSVAQTEEDAFLADVIFNSGVIPLEYEVIDEISLPTSSVKPDYPTVLFAVAAAIIGVVVLIGWRNKGDKLQNMTFIGATGFTFVTWLAYLKVFEVPVDLDIIVFSGFTVIFLLKLFTYRLRDSIKFEILVVGLAMTAYLLSSGYLRLYTSQMVGLSVLAILSVYLMRYYITNMKIMLSK